MENNFDLRDFLYNNTLLTESQKENIEETIEESSNKMTVSELKAKIREDILAELKKESDDPAVGDEEEAHTGVEESQEIEEQEEEETVDVDIDVEEPAGEEDVFASDDVVEDAEKEAYDAIIQAGRAYKALGENPNMGGLKTMIDQLAYLERAYNYPPREDVFENKK
jgi:hypothetical protein